MCFDLCDSASVRFKSYVEVLKKTTLDESHSWHGMAWYGMAILLFVRSFFIFSEPYFYLYVLFWMIDD